MPWAMNGIQTSGTATMPDEAAIPIGAQAFDAMLDAARTTFPREACGILFCDSSAGEDPTEIPRIDRFAIAVNIHPDPETRFEIDPHSLIAAHRTQRAGGAQVLGYFHSHPNGPAIPSALDSALAEGGRAIWAIAGREGDCWELRLWRKRSGTFAALPYFVDNG